MEYLQSMNIIMYVNDARFEQTKYGDEAIFKHSRIVNAQVDQHNPQWIDFSIKKKALNDQSDYLQIIKSSEQEYYSHNDPIVKPTSWNSYPGTHDEFDKYKFASVDL